MKPIFALIPAVLGMVFSGCIMKRSGGAAFRERDWVEGVTGRREVIEAWGNPDVMQGDIWVWRETRTIGGKVKASYRTAGMTVQNLHIITVEHRLRFDESGKLVSAESVKSLPGGEKWSLSPL